MTDRLVKFENVDAAIAEIEQLRHGCTPTGNWSLPQACWHLNQILTYFMTTPARTPMETPPGGPEKLAAILSAGAIPSGIQSPERVLPPANCTDADVTAFITTLQKFKTFAGPFPPHRLFGAMTPEEGKKLNLIHIAHHLSKLIPAAEG
jgi:hypothetical protein